MGSLAMTFRKTFYHTIKTVLFVIGIAVSTSVVAQQAFDEEYYRTAFAAADTDGDGFVSEEEAVRDLIRLYISTDTNADEVISDSELTDYDPAAFNRIDGNADGQLSFMEVLEERLADFAAADTNKDGRLSLEEVLIYARENR